MLRLGWIGVVWGWRLVKTRHMGVFPLKQKFAKFLSQYCSDVEDSGAFDIQPKGRPMPQPLRISLILGALLVLAACGGAGSNPFSFEGRTPFGPISSDEAELVAAQFDSLSGQVLGISVSPEGVVPTVGAATFTGMAQIVVTPQATAQAMTLTGDAVINADFAGPFFAARMDDFAGADMSGSTVRLDGELRVDDARIGGGTGASSDVTGTFRGKLLGDDIEIDAGGAFAGVLRGNPTAAVSFSGVDSTALYNGEAATISLSGVAQE